MDETEIQVELLIGKKVFDTKGELVGRLEEIHLRAEGKDLVVEEYLIGKYGLLERLAVMPFRIPFLPFVRPGKAKPDYKIPWDLFDPTNPHELRSKRSKAELQKLQRDPGGLRSK